MSDRPRIALIGVGNEYRTDDGAGIAAVRDLADLKDLIHIYEIAGDGAEILDAMSDFDEVSIIDASRSGRPPGTIEEFNVADTPLPVHFFSYSTHAFGLAEAIEVARRLGSLPAGARVWSIEGECFESGVGLSDPVSRSVRTVSGTLRRWVGARLALAGQ